MNFTKPKNITEAELNDLKVIEKRKKIQERRELIHEIVLPKVIYMILKMEYFNNDAKALAAISRKNLYFPEVKVFYEELSKLKFDEWAKYSNFDLEEYLMNYN